ncbi:hypothetical protein GNI_102010 [Gregarina niphandrodes]|uniref:Uncharacterized protein n=1 Tax=Gregarina niphandrodes TaxID=110365 RepID=A0A023B4E4_GRENI|nr:hypothetical protein GNI_102010 [Gregarina niphandrodes]EZG56686.1 hypothetical protein GNI_102010 [Gregarina niphandrodes]|eukprot:XP_011131200.1 hypothetical protein GNI_102010 [Gregarina niphandrodes]
MTQALQPLSGVQGPSIFDGTSQTTSEKMTRAVPGIFSQSLVAGVSSEQPSTWSVGCLTTQFDGFGQDRSVNFMYPMEATTSLRPGHVTQIRFAEIPNEQGRYAGAGRSYGLTSVDTFKGDGYDIKGLFIGHQGNLQTQSSLVAGRWLEGFEPSDIVDWFVECQEETLDIYLVVGGRNYGHAFTVPNVKGLGNLRPAVRLAGDRDAAGAAISVMIWTPVPIQSNADYRQVQGPNWTGLSGQWKADNGLIINLNEATTQLKDLSKQVAFSSGHGNKLAGSVRVGLLGQVLEKTAMRSTLMLTHGDAHEKEEEAKQLYASAVSFKVDYVSGGASQVDEDRRLIITAEDGSTKTFQRYFDMSDRSMSVNPWQ